MSNVCVIGTGYVGMASAIGLAELGHRVRGYDILSERIRLLRKGVAPYREQGIAEPLQAHLASGTLTFHARLKEAVFGAEFIILCIGTPARDDGSCDLSQLYAAIRSLSEVMPITATVVLRSTVPPGTTETVQQMLEHMRVVYAPEFLREGSALYDFLNPDRIVVGCLSDQDGKPYLDLFARLAKPHIVTSRRNAELIKASSNAFLAMKVSFANQIANLCDSVGADALEVLRGVGSDSRIGARFLEPGIGFGGPCFEKDVKSLLHVSAQNNCRAELLSATLQVNHDQPKRIVEMIEAQAGSLPRLRIGVWGLAFKAGTNDVRDSIAARIVEELLRRGADVIAYDPQVDHKKFPQECTVAESALEAAYADVLVILTEWAEFCDVNFSTVADRLRTKVIIDGRNILDPIQMERLGIRYYGIGRCVFAENAAEPNLQIAV